MAATYFSEFRSLLRVEKAPIIKWLKFLGAITVYRIVIFYFFWEQPILKNMLSNADFLPWPISFTVFWEDAVHVLPLIILQMLIGVNRKTWIIHALAMLAAMIEFGSGHMYQGAFAAVLLSLYIPFTVKYGKKYGVGTVMVCHVLYDLVTLLLIQNMWRVM